MTETNRRQADARHAATRTPSEAPPDDGYGTRPKCEALHLPDHGDELKRCGMPARELVAYLEHERSLCTAHAKQYREWGTRDQEQMARALWRWPTAGVLGEERTPTLDGMPPARPRAHQLGA